MSHSSELLRTRLAFPEPTALLERLQARYGEPQRHYHDWKHVLACFAARDRLAEPDAAVDLAILYHDAIYDPLAPDNEERSAELLLDEGRREGFEYPTLRRAHALVLATKRHDAAADDAQADVMLDADLSILGEAPAVFAQYELDIRAEYAAVPEAMFVAGRRRVLESFVDRPSVYRGERARALWEPAARDNLAQALATLGT